MWPQLGWGGALQVTYGCASFQSHTSAIPLVHLSRYPNRSNPAAVRRLWSSFIFAPSSPVLSIAYNVFSSRFLARRRCHRRQPQPSIVAHAARRSPNGHPPSRRRRPEGEDCECPTQQHPLGRRRRLQQHHAETVH